MISESSTTKETKETNSPVITPNGTVPLKLTTKMMNSLETRLQDTTPLSTTPQRTNPQKTTTEMTSQTTNDPKTIKAHQG